MKIMVSKAWYLVLSVDKLSFGFKLSIIIFNKKVRTMGFEPKTLGFGVQCSTVGARFSFVLSLFVNGLVRSIF